MCGIVGYIGYRDSQTVLLQGLKRLEYRGYDSAGIAVHTKTGLQVSKAQGRLAVLEGQLHEQRLEGTIGIGHTRWATHGKPSQANAHPHTDGRCVISVVHNGIIENYMELKDALQSQGVVFTSETDTEVVAHLIASYYEGDLISAVQQATRRIRGAYGLGVLAQDNPELLVAVRMHSPLIIGKGVNENFIASDIPAILEYTREVYILHDGEMAILTRESVQITDLQGNAIDCATMQIEWDLQTAEKGGYTHFMFKEIMEQPRAYRDTMVPRLTAQGVVFPELSWENTLIKHVKRIHIVACGTAYHAGIVGKGVIEQVTRIPVEVDVASEYRYRSPILDAQTLVVVVSQSGETADTLAAMREAKRGGAFVLAITNVVASSVAREADAVILTMAGPEIAVASTKAYTTMLIAFNLFAIWLAQQHQMVTPTEAQQMIQVLKKLPEQVEKLLATAPLWEQIAGKIASSEHLFFMGRGLDYAVAQEGSLKLKEISYIHSEAYAAGELKHGTLALITEDVPVIALATQQDVLDKMMSNIIEVKARGARVIALTVEGNTALAKIVDEVVYIPKTADMFAPALAVIPLQLLAYYAATIRGNDVDKPRNLAKSVTVE